MNIKLDIKISTLSECFIKHQVGDVVAGGVENISLRKSPFDLNFE